jgi:translin
VNLRPLADEFHRRFEQIMSAREVVLGASRRSIRASANSIRAIHRGELDEAHRLQAEARAALDEGEQAAAGHPNRLFAGMLGDAQKEYAESLISEAVVTGKDLPTPEELRVDLAPYLNGMAEAIGECRRAILDMLRIGEVGRSEAMLAAMEDMYYLLVSMDYPDGITGQLRRSTDVARSLLEKTRGDLSVSIGQRRLHDALEEHRGNLAEPPS